MERQKKAGDIYRSDPQSEPQGRFVKCKNGERVSQCYHVPRCENIPGHGFGQIEPKGDQA